MNYKSKRSRATDIPIAVKMDVFERDSGCCIFCGRPGLSNAHFISRAQGGLGIEENIVTACPLCHLAMDNSDKRSIYLQRAEEYLRSKYPNWDKGRLVYNKWAEK